MPRGIPPQAQVEIKGRGDGGFHFGKELIPNADGSFQFKVPAGVYTLELRPMDQGTSRRTLPKTELTVADGQAEAEVMLTVPDEGWGDLIVEVADKNGQPLSGVTVLSGGFGVSGNAPTGKTDDAGRFLVKGIQAGSHHIVLTDPARMLNENMRLTVLIEAGKTVTHRIVLDEGQPSARPRNMRWPTGQQRSRDGQRSCPKPVFVHPYR